MVEFRLSNTDCDYIRHFILPETEAALVDVTNEKENYKRILPKTHIPQFNFHFSCRLLNFVLVPYKLVKLVFLKYFFVFCYSSNEPFHAGNKAKKPWRELGRVFHVKSNFL